MKKVLLLGTVLMGTLWTACAAGGGYAAMRFGPPPPPRYGVIGYSPGPGFVWADGYWDQRGGRWFWVGGRWMRPPHGRTGWEPGAWRQEGRRWRFQRGHWR